MYVALWIFKKNLLKTVSSEPAVKKNKNVRKYNC